MLTHGSCFRQEQLRTGSTRVLPATPFWPCGAPPPGFHVTHIHLEGEPCIYVEREYLISHTILLPRVCFPQILIKSTAECSALDLSGATWLLECACSVFWRFHDHSVYWLIMNYLVVDSVGVRGTHMATSICIYSAGRIILKPEKSSFFAWDLSTVVSIPFSTPSSRDISWWWPLVEGGGYGLLCMCSRSKPLGNRVCAVSCCCRVCSL